MINDNDLRDIDACVAELATLVNREKLTVFCPDHKQVKSVEPGHFKTALLWQTDAAMAVVFNDLMRGACTAWNRSPDLNITVEMQASGRRAGIHRGSDKGMG